MSNTTVVPCPRVGITLYAPWWCTILWAGKRRENRWESVARSLKRWRGPIALTASKTWNQLDVRSDLLEINLSIQPTWTKSLVWRDIHDRAGCIVGIADLVAVEPNGKAPPDPWAVPGQWSLMLNNVREVIPVPCTGGRGAFRFGSCSGCTKPTAFTGSTMVCRAKACKTTTPRAEVVQPMLTVVNASPSAPAHAAGSVNGPAGTA